MLKGCLINGLESQNIYLTNEELNTFIEAAVKKLTKNGKSEVFLWQQDKKLFNLLLI